MVFENKKALIAVLLTIFFFLGLSGLSRADSSGESGIRIQDINEWYDYPNNVKEDSHFAYTHYVNIPFNIYLFSAKNNLKDNDPINETTTFYLELFDKNSSHKEDLVPDGITMQKGAKVSSPIKIVVPSEPTGAEWYIRVKTDNPDFYSGGGNDGEIRNIGEIKIDNFSNISPKVELDPKLAEIKKGNQAIFTAKLVDAFGNDLVLSEIDQALNEWEWTSSNSKVAILEGKVTTPEGTKSTFKGLEPGQIIVTAKYGNIEGEATLIVEESIKNEPHHLTVVPIDDDKPPVSQLHIRSDTGPSTSTWGYIGQPMTINVALQMHTENHETIQGYFTREIINRFIIPEKWNLEFSSSEKNSPQLSLNVVDLKVDKPDNPSTLKATLEVLLETEEDVNEYNDIMITINPIAPKDITLEEYPAVAYVLNSEQKIDESKYNLYKGQIRVEDKFFYTIKGKVEVFVEKHHNGKYIANVDDSTTSVIFNDEVLGITNKTIGFKRGRAIVDVENKTGITERELVPVSYPPYFGCDAGTLTWAQNPKDGKGTIWEKEILD